MLSVVKHQNLKKPIFRNWRTFRPFLWLFANIFRQNHTMIALLTGIVVVLVVCHTPKTVIDIYECYQVLRILSHSGIWSKWCNTETLKYFSRWFCTESWDTDHCGWDWPSGSPTSCCAFPQLSTSSSTPTRHQQSVSPSSLHLHLS